MGQALRAAVAVLGLVVFVAPALGQAGVQCRQRDYVEFLETPGSTLYAIERDGIGLFPWGGGVSVFDLTNATEPVLLSTFEYEGYLRNIDLVDDVVYVSTTEELRLVSIADPSEPIFLGSYPHSLWRVAVQGDRAYTYAGYNDLVLVDFSDPANPAELFVWSLPEPINDLQWIGDSLYASRSGGGVDIFDVSVWWDPQHVGSIETPGARGQIETDGQLAYIESRGTLWVFDVSNVVEPRLLSETYTGFHSSPFVVRDGLLYGTGRESLEIFDVSNPVEPERVGWYDVRRWPDGVVVAGEYALVGANNGGIYVLDVSEPKLPPPTALVPEAADTKKGAWQPGLYCAARGVDGVTLVDVADPWNPVPLGTIDTPGVAVDVALAGDLLCVADMAGGLRVIDVAAPGEPQEVGAFDSIGNAATIAASGQTAFVGGMMSPRVEVIDLTVPSEPVRVAVLDLPRRPLGLVAQGELLYVADGAAGLVIVDVSVPSAPTIVGSVDTPGTAYDVWIEADVALVADGQQGVQIIDVSDPHAPFLVGSIETEGSAFAVSHQGGVGVVVEQAWVLEVLDISNPASPVITGWHRVDGQADLVLVGNAAIVAGGSRALQIVDVGDCSPCRVDTNNDGSVDSRDVIAFLNAWVSGDTSGDFNGDGSVDTDDVVQYLEAWGVGC